MAVSFSRIPQASSIFAAYASLSAFIMLVQTMLNQLVPRHVQDYLLDLLRHFFKPRRDYSTVVIEEREGMSPNEVYAAVETYLCTKIRPNIDRLKISKRHKEIGFTVKFAQSERISDRYEDIELEWRFVNQEMKSESKSVNPDNNILYFENEKRFFELRFDKKYKDRVIDVYLPFVMDAANSIRDEKKVVRLHTLAFGSQYEQSIVWNSINLEHPSTFGTLAIEGRLKRSIMEDLDRFVRRKDFYRKVGKAWKRGYLLYGPPGTGKSSLIAAIANYLKFDIYDLELTNVRRDSDLRRLLLRTANRSILVIEDIDCTVALPDRNEKAADAYGYRHREEKFTLSGLLNFIDGLWSSCGDERIIIFTTNNKEKLDPALLRPGRMDMHIHMSYLTPDGFKLLASTYLNVDHGHHRPILSEIEGMVENMNVTPAEVAEEFMKSDDVDTSLRGLLEYLCEKKKEMKKNIGVENDEGDKEE